MFSEFSLDKWALRLGYFAGDIVGLPAGLIKKMIESGYAWKEKNKILCTWGGVKKNSDSCLNRTPVFFTHVQN